jgi:hypothetical protein
MLAGSGEQAARLANTYDMNAPVPSMSTEPACLASQTCKSPEQQCLQTLPSPLCSGPLLGSSYWPDPTAVAVQMLHLLGQPEATKPDACATTLRV